LPIAVEPEIALRSRPLVPERLASLNEKRKCTRAPVVEHDANLFLRLDRVLSMTLAIVFQQRYYDDLRKRGGNADADS
jgi:hypothetical protein